MLRSEPRERSETLRRILQQEARRGYDDGAVIGGLERFLANWEAEGASGDNAKRLSDIGHALHGYHDLDPAERQARVKSALDVLGGKPPPAASAQSNDRNRRAAAAPAQSPARPQSATKTQRRVATKQEAAGAPRQRKRRASAPPC